MWSGKESTSKRNGIVNMADEEGNDEDYCVMEKFLFQRLFTVIFIYFF